MKLSVPQSRPDIREYSCRRRTVLIVGMTCLHAVRTLLAMRRSEGCRVKLILVVTQCVVHNFVFQVVRH